MRLFVFILSVFVSFQTSYAAVSSSTIGRKQKLAALEYYLDHIEVTQKGRSWPTIGFELEGVFPGKTRDDAFTSLYRVIAREIIPHLYSGRDVNVENFHFKTRRGDPRQGTKLKVRGQDPTRDIEWQIKDDGSIVPPHGYVGVELVSPILRGRREILSSYGWIRTLSRHGLLPEPNSAAFQVHAGFTDRGPLAKDVVTDSSVVAETMVMMLVFSKIEKELMREYGTTASRQKFTMPTPQEVIEVVEGGKVDVEKTVLSQFLEKYFEYRYWALNFHALFQFGTVELRIANSTTNVREVESLVDLIGTLTQAVRSKNARLVRLVKKHIDGDIPLRELAETLDLKLGKRFCEQLLGAG